ncbi:MAG: nucleotidyltransferase family protein [Candidatus Latescibacterota bacterium]|jgi:mannose-1-phosphate guanylyltransferase
MKVFLLAGGLGTRLRPLTDHIPKCLVPVCGRPLIDYWFDLFDGLGVNEVLVNMHHLSDLVEAHFIVHPWKDRVRLFHEPELLGSAGTVRANRNFVGNDDFLVCYADNLTDTNLSVIWDRHQKGDSILTMGLFHTPFPKECGIATLDKDGHIIDFVEKPQNPASNLANAGIYAVSPEIFDVIGDQPSPVDFGFDIIPKLSGRMAGVAIDGFLMDVGTVERYESVQKLWPH